MKGNRFLISIAFIFSTLILSAQTIVTMEEHNGVYRVPCLVNGAKMKFILDTGATNVCLSMPMAEYLLDNGYIDKEDFVGNGSSAIADGSIVNNLVLNIKDIEIAGLHIYNVQAIVIDGQEVPLLMGQSAIQKLGCIELNGASLIINKDHAENNQTMIDKLLKDANDAYDNKLYDVSVEKYSQLYSMNGLSDYGIYCYAWSCYMNKEDEKAELLLKSIDNFKYFDDNKIDIYRLIGHVKCALKKFTEAVPYYEMSSKKIITEKSGWLTNFRHMADCCYFSNNYSKAAEYYRYAVGVYGMICNVDIKYLQRDSKNQLKKKEKSYRCDEIDYLLFYLFFCNERCGNFSSEDFLFEITAMSRANNKYATRYLNEAGINPYDSCWQ